MYRTKQLFDRYFSGGIDESALIAQLELNSDHAEARLQNELSAAIAARDADMVECLVYALLLWQMVHPDGSLHRFLPLLNRLIICSWHTQHENILLLLQRLADATSVRYLYMALFVPLSYMAWDDDRAFQKRCIHLIGAIGTEEAIAALNTLHRVPRHVVQWNVSRQLGTSRAS